MKPYTSILWALIIYLILICARPDLGFGALMIWLYTYQKVESL